MALYRCGGAKTPALGTITVSIRGTTTVFDPGTSQATAYQVINGSGTLNPNNSNSASFNLTGSTGVPNLEINNIRTSGTGTIVYNPATRSVDITVGEEEA